MASMDNTIVATAMGTIIGELGGLDIPASTLDKISEGLSTSISYTFVLALIPAVLALIAAFMMSKEKMDPQAEAEAYAAAH